MRTIGMLAVLLAFCDGMVIAEKREAKELSPDFLPRDVDTVIVLSVADVRNEEDSDVSEIENLDKMAYNYLRRGLKKQGYIHEFRGGFGSAKEVTLDDLENRDKDWARALGGGDARWVLLPSLRVTWLVSPFWAECGAYLVDTEAGTVVWHDVWAMRRPGGIIGAAMPNAQRNGSIRECYMVIVKTLPKRKKK